MAIQRKVKASNHPDVSQDKDPYAVTNVPKSAIDDIYSKSILGSDLGMFFGDDEDDSEVSGLLKSDLKSTVYSEEVDYSSTSANDKDDVTLIDVGKDPNYAVPEIDEPVTLEPILKSIAETKVTKKKKIKKEGKEPSFIRSAPWMNNNITEREQSHAVTDDDEYAKTIPDYSEDREYVSMDVNKDLLKSYLSQYDQLMKDRIATGNRLYAAFLKHMGIPSNTQPYAHPVIKSLLQLDDQDEVDERKVLTEIIRGLQKDYKKITYAVAESVFSDKDCKAFAKQKYMYTAVAQMPLSRLERELNELFLTRKDEYKWIRSISIYHYVRLFTQLVNLEKQQKSVISSFVRGYDIWNHYLKYVTGCAEVTAARLIAKINFDKISKVSQLHAFAGFDVVVDPETGEHQGRRNGFRSLGGRKMTHHLVTRVFKDSKGNVKESQVISYNPYVKVTMYNLFTCFLKNKNPFYLQIYQDYKNRIIQRNEVNNEGLTLFHINMMAFRYTMKMFLTDVMVHAKLMKKGGMEMAPPYSDSYLKHTSRIRTINLELSNLENDEAVMEVVNYQDIYQDKYLTGKLKKENNIQDYFNPDAHRP